MNNIQVIIIAISLVIGVFSVIMHEIMHGYVALLFGDHTAENAGRLTFNPLPHIDPIGTLLLPIISYASTFSSHPFFFAYAKPVPVNPLHFSNIKKGEIFVSSAGIVTNFVLAVLFAILYHLSNSFIPNFFLSEILKTGVIINLILAILNVLPLPPLDGSKIVMAILPYELAREYQKLDNMYGFMFLILLALTGVLAIIIGLILPIFLALLQIPF